MWLKGELPVPMTRPTPPATVVHIRVSLLPSFSLYRDHRRAARKPMFNAPRGTQRYSVSNSATNGTGGMAGSFTQSENPLANSTYSNYDGGLDPWSSAPTPDLPPMPPASSSPFASVLGM